MKIYLDSCSLQRPLDNKTQIRVLLEAEVIIKILSLVEAGKIELVSSEALIYETANITDLTRKEYAEYVLRKAKTFINLNDEIEKLAKEIVKFEFMPLDALHLAFAEYSKAEYFCTTDDKLIKKAKQLTTFSIKVVSPIDLIEEIEK